MGPLIAMDDWFLDILRDFLEFQCKCNRYQCRLQMQFAPALQNGDIRVASPPVRLVFVSRLSCD
jgi:hypothetical protein